MSAPLSAASALASAAPLAPHAHAAPPARGPIHFAGTPITETGTFPPADSRHCWVYVTLNAEIALAAPGNAPLQNLVTCGRARVSVDGQWLWWALRRKYPGTPVAKLSGSDLIHTLAEHAARHGARLLLLGSTPEANGSAVHRLRQRWPGLAVAGYAPPHFDSHGPGEAAVIAGTLQAVQAWRADYVVLGLGAGKEHRLAARIAPLLDGRVRGICCFGGAIDMAGGSVHRAPAWVQRAGLEGPWRVAQQPTRAWRFVRVLRLLPLLARGRY
jgi:N-acetylglucosaminyldiphosphoundecaprenol N-acetyl-beta-D-mannosaminyltransferase